MFIDTHFPTHFLAPKERNERPESRIAARNIALRWSQSDYLVATLRPAEQRRRLKIRTLLRHPRTCPTFPRGVGFT